MENAVVILSVVAAVLAVSYLALSRYVKRKTSSRKEDGNSPTE